jgi:hypothetical protein
MSAWETFDAWATPVGDAILAWAMPDGVPTTTAVGFGARKWSLGWAFNSA